MRVADILNKRTRGSEESTPQRAKALKNLANESEPFTSYQEQSGAGKRRLSKNALYKETYLREVVENSSPRRGTGPTVQPVRS